MYASPTLPIGDVEAIEFATLNALPPARRLKDDGWILTANRGVIGRANSVLPMRPGIDPVDVKIARAIAFYANQSLPAAFRVSTYSQPQRLRDALTTHGFKPVQPTLVMTTEVGRPLSALADVLPGRLIDKPDPAWRALFVGPGTSRRDGEGRVATLSRAEGTVFAEVRLADDTAAIGALAGLGDWAGVHGMRTAPFFRRRGLARRVLATLVREADKHGYGRLFLQVEEANAPAIALYRSLGFESAYRYDYWRR